MHRRESNFKHMFKTAVPPVAHDAMWEEVKHQLIYIMCMYSVTLLYSSQVREQFVNDPAFESITEEQERVRIFKEFRKTIKVNDNY